MFNFGRFALCIAFGVVLLGTTKLAPRVSGQNLDYLPFSRSLLRPFPLKRIGLPGDLISGRTLTVADIQVVEEKSAGIENESDSESIHHLAFSGRNIYGTSWSVKAQAGNYYESFYTGDIDRNGKSDVILAIGTGGNGLAPTTRLIFLTFDRKGDPTIFEGTGYYQTGPNGILDVADLDRDGRAELVHMLFDDGYWITNVYRVRNSRWSLVRGRFANMSFPLYTRFTIRPNHKPVKPRRGRNPVAPNLLKKTARQ